MIRSMKALGALLIASALVACGGGGGSAGGTSNTGGGGGSTANPTSAVADFAVFTDSSTITNNGTDSALLTVVAVDANRNVVPGATVVVSTDAGSVYVPANTVTDATGAVTGTIQTGGDKTDRDITVSVTVNGVTKRTSVRVSGSKLTLAATPAAPVPGQNVTLTATLLDAGGTGISGKVITLGGNLPGVTGQTITTGPTGQGSLTFAAPTTAGVYTISASGSGTIAADYQITVFASGAAVPSAVIPAGVNPSLSASPNVLSINTAGSEANKSVLRFLMLDASNQPVQNVRVRFVDQTTGLAAVGAKISSGDTVLYTDNSGSVSTQYIAGQNNSPTNGVRVRACYKATDFTSTSDCPSFVDVTLTVAGQALALSIGDDNLLQKGPGGAGTYIKRFAVTVADSAGRAVANAPVDISVDLTHYSKGSTTQTLSISSVPLSPTAAFPSLTTAPGGGRVWCPNEDANRNGSVDPTTVFGSGTTSENYNGSVDSNGQPTLEPRKSDLIISYDDPTVTTTNERGVLVIRVEYSQRFATWLAYKVRVTANVSGSQGLSERLFVTNFLQEDAENGSFLTPPYGVNSCVSPN